MEEYAKAFTKYIDELIELKVREKALETYLGEHLYINKKMFVKSWGFRLSERRMMTDVLQHM